MLVEYCYSELSISAALMLFLYSGYLHHKLISSCGFHMFTRSSGKVLVFIFPDGDDVVLFIHCITIWYIGRGWTHTWMMWQQLNLFVETIFWELLVEEFYFGCQYFFQSRKTRCLGVHFFISNCWSTYSTYKLRGFCCL